MAQPAWASAAALQGTLAASAQNVAACTCSSSCEKRLALATAVARQHIALGLAPQHTRALRTLPSHGVQLQEPHVAVAKQTQQMAQLLEQQSLQIQAQQDALQKLLQKRDSLGSNSTTGLQRTGTSENRGQQKQIPFSAAGKSSLVKQHAFGGNPTWVDRNSTSIHGPEHDAPSAQPEQDGSQAGAAAASPDFEDPHKAKTWQTLTHLQQRMLGGIADAEEAAGMLATTGQEREQGSLVTALVTEAPRDTQVVAAAPQVKLPAALSCGLSDSDVHRILAHRRAYIKRQRAFDRACVGNEQAAFDPTQVVESIADMLLDDVLQQSAAELGAACDSLAEDMFESEFVVGSGKPRTFLLAGRLSL
ncbi:hypothetical protein WJX79_001272 [Trebouxia sp. C0005]